MIASLCCFGILFLFQGIAAAVLLEYFSTLSKKRRDGSITEFEKWIQGFISIPLKPALEAVLAKDPVRIRVLLSISVMLSAIISLLITSYEGVLIVAIVLLTIVWLSALSDLR